MQCMALLGVVSEQACQGVRPLVDASASGRLLRCPEGGELAVPYPTQPPTQPR